MRGHFFGGVHEVDRGVEGADLRTRVRQVPLREDLFVLYADPVPCPGADAAYRILHARCVRGPHRSADGTFKKASSCLVRWGGMQCIMSSAELALKELHQQAIVALNLPELASPTNKSRLTQWDFGGRTS
jgi:hypothetical protein